MSFLILRQPEVLPPPPPHRLDERDRFGLPIIPPALLSETPEQRQARIATIEQLVRDLFQTAMTHLDRVEARRLFESVVKERWTKGKQPDQERNQQLLARYDTEAAKTPNKIREIPRRLGVQMHPGEPSQAESLARRIRRLVSDRNRRQKAREEAYRRFGPTLLEKAITNPSTDI